jgi:hypothetical protein
MRAQLPACEEIEALLAGRRQTAIVFFLDETFEELDYDATTTVLEAVEFLAGIIKLQAYQTFTLYECRKVGGPLSLLCACLLPTSRTHARDCGMAGKRVHPGMHACSVLLRLWLSRAAGRKQIWPCSQVLFSLLMASFTGTLKRSLPTYNSRCI